MVRMYEARQSFLLWFGLVFAFSPVLRDLTENLLDHRDQRYTLLAPLLIGLLLRHDPASRCIRRIGAGIALLAVGLVAQSIGIAAGSWSIARVGLPFGVLGVALLTGRPSLAMAALVFWAIPVPSSVQFMASPEAESMLGAGAAEVLSWVGLKIDLGGPLLSFGGEHLELTATDNGIITASALSAVGWFVALRSGRSARSAALTAVCWATSVIVVQPIVVVLGVATLPLGVPELGRFLLTHGPCLALALLALLVHAFRRSGAAPLERGDLRTAI